MILKTGRDHPFWGAKKVAAKYFKRKMMALANRPSRAVFSPTQKFEVPSLPLVQEIWHLLLLGCPQALAKQCQYQEEAGVCQQNVGI